MDSIETLVGWALGDLRDPLTGFVLVVVLTTLIYLHYRRFGGALTGKQSFAPVLPFVGLTTFLVITTVKSSFALSLGLVGALSIVRFRTPVKDPEELAYIFLTIAAGIGAAAGQRRFTAVIVVLILVVVTLMRRSGRPAADHVFVSLDVGGATDAEVAFATVGAALNAHSRRQHVTRVEHHGDVLHVTAELELPEPNAVPRIVARVRREYPETSISAHDESRFPSP